MLAYGFYGKWEPARVNDQSHQDLAGCANGFRNFGQLLCKLAGGVSASLFVPEIINGAVRIIDTLN